MKETTMNHTTLGVVGCDVSDKFAELEVAKGKAYAEASFGVFITATTMMNIMAASALKSEDAGKIFEPLFRFFLKEYDGAEREEILDFGMDFAKEVRERVLSEEVARILRRQRMNDDTTYH